MLQGFLGFLLIVPEIGRGDLVFELSQFGAFGVYVKETSAVRRRGISDHRAARASPARHWHLALLDSFTDFR